MSAFGGKAGNLTPISFGLMVVCGGRPEGKPVEGRNLNEDDFGSDGRQ